MKMTISYELDTDDKNSDINFKIMHSGDDLMHALFNIQYKLTDVSRSHSIPISGIFIDTLSELGLLTLYYEWCEMKSYQEKSNEEE